MKRWGGGGVEVAPWPDKEWKHGDTLQGRHHDGPEDLVCVRWRRKEVGRKQKHKPDTQSWSLVCPVYS